MRVFLTHISRDKPLLREVRGQLPPHAQTWLDEDTLLIADNTQASIRAAVELNSDLVLLFIGLEAVRSKWLRTELEWALEQEKDLGRVFVLPVVTDEYAWKIFEPAKFRERKYLLCTDFSESGVAAFAEKLQAELFAWTSRQLEQSSTRADTPKRVSPPKRPDTPKRADTAKRADAPKKADGPKKADAPKKADGPKIVVEAVGVDLPTGALDGLRAQGAPLATLEAARELLGGVPEHGLVIRARNEGTRAVKLKGYGILARQNGKKNYSGHPDAPTAHEMPSVTIDPGYDNECVIDLERLAKKLTSPNFDYRGSAEIRGYYEGFDGIQYRSDPVVLNLETYGLEGE
jgi:hypothetical protein